MFVSPLERGLRGVTVRGAVGMFLLLFFEVLSVGLQWLFWFEVAMHGRHTSPAPLERGVLRYCFLFDN